MSLGFDAEMGAAFLERDLKLPAGDEPLEDIDRSGAEIGAEEGLWRELTARIADQQPANGHRGQTAVVPDSGAGGDLDGTIGAAVPKSDGVVLPNGIGVVQDLTELRQALALNRWPSAARTLGRCGSIQIGVEPQSGDDTDITANRGEEADGGKSGVADEHDAAAGQPAVDLHGDLAGAIQQRLGRARFAGIEPLGRCKHGEKRQPHDAAGPGYMNEQLRGQPAQAAGLHKMSFGGADRVTIDAASADLVPPAPLNGIVDANHHGGAGADEGGDQQAQQPACHGAGRPHGSVEHAMVDREVGLLLPTQNPQCRSDGSLARRQDGTRHQQQDVLPGRAGKHLGQAGKPRQQARRQGDSQNAGMGSGCFIPSVESTRSNRSKLRPRRQAATHRARTRATPRLQPHCRP